MFLTWYTRSDYSLQIGSLRVHVFNFAYIQRLFVTYRILKLNWVPEFWNFKFEAKWKFPVCCRLSTSEKRNVWDEGSVVGVSTLLEVHVFGILSTGWGVQCVYYQDASWLHFLYAKIHECTLKNNTRYMNALSRTTPSKSKKSLPTFFVVRVGFGD